MEPLEKLTTKQYRSFLKLYRFHLNRLYALPHKMFQNRIET